MRTGFAYVGRIHFDRVRSTFPRLTKLSISSWNKGNAAIELALSERPKMILIITVRQKIWFILFVLNSNIYTNKYIENKLYVNKYKE